GLAYWWECVNPFVGTVTARNLPLGLHLETYKRDAVGRGLYKRGVHEPVLTQFLISNFENATNCNFIDVGANIGYFTCLMARLAGPFGKVLAFEPEPQNFKLLERNLHFNHLSNIVARPYALGEIDGTARLGLYKAANRGRHSLLTSEGQPSVEVSVRRLDDVA